MSSAPKREFGWDKLEGPLRALIWVAFIAAMLAIFRLAESLVEHIFAVVLLFVFASIIAVVLTPIADLFQRIPGFRPEDGLRCWCSL